MTPTLVLEGSASLSCPLPTLARFFCCCCFCSFPLTLALGRRGFKRDRRQSPVPDSLPCLLCVPVLPLLLGTRDRSLQPGEGPLPLSVESVAQGVWKSQVGNLSSSRATAVSPLGISTFHVPRGFGDRGWGGEVGTRCRGRGHLRQLYSWWAWALFKERWGSRGTRRCGPWAASRRGQDQTRAPLWKSPLARVGSREQLPLLASVYFGYKPFFPLSAFGAVSW